MATASLTADLLARKGSAQPTRKWLRDSSLILHPGRPQPSKGKPAPAKAKPVTKTLRLDKQMNRQLKLLSVRMDQSQQSLMEEALRQYMHQCLDNADCICGAEE